MGIDEQFAMSLVAANRDKGGRKQFQTQFARSAVCTPGIRATRRS